jgi:endoglucanase
MQSKFLRFSFLVVFFLMLVACRMVLGDDASVFNPFLKAVDHEIRDNHGQGDVIYLRGVNLGGWLLFEGWQTPMDAGNLKDDWSVREVLAHRFGAEMRDSLIASYEDAWITEADLDHIASLGFNVIRLPFWHRNLQEENGTWRQDRFEKIDWLVANAWKRHIYVILDFHGLPGGQSEDHSTGRVRKKSETWVEPDFWNNEENLRRSTEIWQAVATQFKDNPAVAAYDLINEPLGAPDREALWKVYDRFYKAVRSIDPDHIITLEGCWSGEVDGNYIGWGLDVLPDPKKFGWTNVVYQMHAYEYDAPYDLEKQRRKSESIIHDIDAHQGWNVPCLIGEFNCMAPAPGWDYTIHLYEDNHVNWTMWTYKATHGPDTDSWGVYNPKDTGLAKPDIKQDPAEVIKNKWSKWTTDLAFMPNPNHLRDMTMPVPVDDRYTCRGGTKLVVDGPGGVLANDTDLNPDAGKRTSRLVTNPAQGSLILNEDGSFTYTPTNMFFGADHFRYRVFDGKHESVFIGTVTINVE